MKARILIIIAFAFLLLTGCKSNQEKELTDAEAQELLSKKMQDAPVKTASVNEIPEWLSIDIEELKHTSDTILFKIRVYKGDWKQNTFYLIDEPSACPLCKVYYKDGTKIEWNSNDVATDFIANSKNWFLVFQCGIGLGSK